MRRDYFRSLVVAAVLLGGTSGLVFSAGSPADLERARTAFERHNYKVALETVDRYLEKAAADGPQTVEARLIRGRCLLKLRSWEEGVDELETLLKTHARLAGRIELHEALGALGLEQHRYKHLAVEHFGIIADLHVKAGDKQAAAQALLKQAEGFVGFDQWERLACVEVEKPQTWRDSRRLQRVFAVQALDRAIELAGDSEVAAEATFRKGQLYQRDLRVEQVDVGVALEIFAGLIERWPQSPRAPEALYQMAQLHESFKEDFVAAVEHYRRVLTEYGRSSWSKRAARRLERILAPVIELGVEGPALPGTPGPLHYRCRNVKSVTFNAYRADLFELIRKVGYLNRLDTWQSAGPPAATWNLTLPDRGEHKFFDSRSGDGRPGGRPLRPTALPVQDPGAYVIVAEDDEHRTQARTVMLVSGLACLTKGARSATLLLAADTVSGQPAAGAEVLIQGHLRKDRFEYASGKTDDGGRFRLVNADRDKRDGGRTSMLLVRDGEPLTGKTSVKGEHYAVCNSSFHWYWWGYGQPYRAYSFTERPVYRPDQPIHFKTIIRRYDKGSYENLPHHQLTIQVRNPRGELIEEQKLKSNDQGSASGVLRLPEDAPLGVYRMVTTVDGRSLSGDAEARFRVEEYRKPEFEVTVTADRPDYRIGQPIDVRIETRYYFGEPVVEARVAATVYRSRHRPHFRWPTPWPWYFEDRAVAGGARGFGKAIFPPGDYWRRRPERELIGKFDLTTDQDGVALLRINTAPLEADPDADLRYDIEAEVTDASRRVITGTGSVKVTHQPFYISVRPQRYVYQPGDTVRLEIEARGPNDDPVAFGGLCRVHRLRRRTDEAGSAAGEPTDQYALGDKVFERPVKMEATGVGQVQWVADQEGPFRVLVTADGQRDVAVTGSCDLWIAKHGGRYEHYAYRDVELIVDRPSYAVGDTARVLINTRFDSCYVLLTCEADDLLSDRTIFVKGGTHLVELPITRAHVPNFELAASVLRDNRIYQDRVSVVVPPADRFLDVRIETPGDKFYPGQQFDLDVITADSAGKPAPAEVAVMIVDAGIYYIQPEFREQIEKHFYGRKRPHLVQTQTSFDYYGYGPGVRGRGRAAGRDVELLAAAPGARAMKSMAAPEMEAAEAKDEFAVAEIRKDFPDTVLWAAHVTTDQAGRAQVKATMPDTLTTWRIHAIAVDRDTRVGQTAGDVVTRKDIIARLEAPRFLVERDEPIITVIAHNYLPEEKTVRVSLESSGEIELARGLVNGRPAGDPSSEAVEVRVPPEGEVAVDFPARAVVAGRARLTATAAADVDADAVQIDLPVITYGADRFLAQSGSIRQEDAPAARTVSFTIPQEVAPESPLMEIHLNPSIAAVMIDALPFLLEYPYGCTEQTMSRFLPAVVTRRTLQQLGIDLAAVRRRIDAQGGQAATTFPRRFRTNPVFNDAVMNDMIGAGLQRLAELQRPDGGWGWWGGGASNPYMTAYVVYGLTEAVAADVPFDRSMLDRGVAFLQQRVVSTEPACRYAWARDDDNVRTWMLYALAMYDRTLLVRDDIRAVLDRIYEHRDDLTDYSRAMLMIALHRIGDRQRVSILIENLYNTVRLDDELATASWAECSSYRYWYNNGTEATAMVLRALLMTNPDHAYVPRAVNWLVRNRRGSRWFNTKDTAFAVYALADYLVASGELRADMTVGVSIDGRIDRSFRITPENALTFDAALIVLPKNLTPGTHTVELTRNGQGNLYYGVYLDYFTRQDPIEPAGHEVFITRKYARLVPKEVTKTRDVWDYNKQENVKETYRALDYERVPVKEGDAIASGQLIEVQLSIDARNNFEYLIFEDPKPAGCEPTELHSGRRYGPGAFDNVELRDKKTAFFASYLSQGKHELTYKLRCETPGTFCALPARVEAMYSPFVRANSRSDMLTIGDK